MMSIDALFLVLDCALGGFLWGMVIVLNNLRRGKKVSGFDVVAIGISGTIAAGCIHALLLVAVSR